MQNDEQRLAALKLESAKHRARIDELNIDNGRLIDEIASATTRIASAQARLNSLDVQEAIERGVIKADESGSYLELARTDRPLFNKMLASRGFRPSSSPVSRADYSAGYELVASVERSGGSDRDEVEVALESPMVVVTAVDTDVEVTRAGPAAGDELLASVDADTEVDA